MYLLVFGWFDDSFDPILNFLLHTLMVGHFLLFPLLQQLFFQFSFFFLLFLRRFLFGVGGRVGAGEVFFSSLFLLFLSFGQIVLKFVISQEATEKEFKLTEKSVIFASKFWLLSFGDELCPHLG